MGIRGFAVAQGREGLRWKAYLLVPTHHEECDDSECSGMLMPQGAPIATAWTESGLRRRVRAALHKKIVTEEQIARSEALGG